MKCYLLFTVTTMEPNVKRSVKMHRFKNNIKVKIFKYTYFFRGGGMYMKPADRQTSEIHLKLLQMKYYWSSKSLIWIASKPLDLFISISVDQWQTPVDKKEKKNKTKSQVTRFWGGSLNLINTLKYLERHWCPMQASQVTILYDLCSRSIHTSYHFNAQSVHPAELKFLVHPKRRIWQIFPPGSSFTQLANDVNWSVQLRMTKPKVKMTGLKWCKCQN